MTRTIALTALLAATAGAFLAGITRFRGPGVTAASSVAPAVRYVCPMHPQYTSDRPGVAPCCGMQLVPEQTSSSLTSSRPFPAGTVNISTEKQQLIGVRVEEAQHTASRQELRLVGRVVPDETRTYVIRARAHGWVRDGSHHTRGSLVRAGEQLADFYSKELLRAQQDYLFALATREQLKSRALTPEQVKQADVEVLSRADTLEALGMHDEDIRRLTEKHEVVHSVPLRAPATGILLKRNVSAGQGLMQNEELFRIADLRRVWVLADVLGLERRLIRPGQKARVYLPGEGQVHPGVVSNALAEFDEASHSLKMRLELANERLELRPGMLVDAILEFQLPPAISVPADAVLDSGLRKLVYVDRGEGYFEPRIVQTGWRFGDRVQITDGLEAGERIVVGGNFLIDSESRIQARGAAAIRVTERDPVCGMEVDPAEAKAAGRVRQHGVGTYYFCSDQCKRDFDPARAAGATERQGRQSAVHTRAKG